MKKILLISVLLILAVGVGFAAIPFLSALRPSEQALNALPQIDVSNMSPESYKFHYLDTENDFGISFLIIKNVNDDLKIFKVPTFRGTFMMPDTMWFRNDGVCINFGPEMQGDKIKPDGIIKCNDSGLTDWQGQEWRWRDDGKRMGNWSPDLLKVKYKSVAGTVTIGVQ